MRVTVGAGCRSAGAGYVSAGRRCKGVDVRQYPASSCHPWRVRPRHVSIKHLLLAATNYIPPHLSFSTIKTVCSEVKVVIVKTTLQLVLNVIISAKSFEC